MKSNISVRWIYKLHNAFFRKGFLWDASAFNIFVNLRKNRIWNSYHQQDRIYLREMHRFRLRIKQVPRRSVLTQWVETKWVHANAKFHYRFFFFIRSKLQRIRFEETTNIRDDVDIRKRLNEFCSYGEWNQKCSG